ncbi:uncharacterized protein PAC_06399 [Phialocephala subalpina]|uniref:Uncharacterized protein n=1 Tax=Phialocephala subalpina TaxID=576137 RepID=A0A1L7WUU1_9HELO|nr:uncharacterized protein PAC_06399 [Phialocephala subalpina]
MSYGQESVNREAEDRERQNQNKNDPDFPGQRKKKAGKGDVLHEILRVELRSGEHFAVDITGDQYGYVDQPVTEWNAYRHSRVKEIFLSLPAPEPLGIVEVTNYSQQAMTTLAGKLLTDSNGLVNLDMLQTMCLHILEWQADGGMSMEHFWKLPEEEFLTRRNDLLSYVEWMFHSDPQQVYFTLNGRCLRQLIHGPWFR